MYPWLSTAVFVGLLALLVYHATTRGTVDVDTWIMMTQEWGMR